VIFGRRGNMLGMSLVKKAVSVYKRLTTNPVDVTTWEEFLDKIDGDLEVQIFIRNCDRSIYFVSFDCDGIERYRCWLDEFSSAVLPSTLLLKSKAMARMKDCLKRWPKIRVRIYSFGFDEYYQQVENLIHDSNQN
jgi:hypothetical protein